jgi:hypothetical protein
MLGIEYLRQANNSLTSSGGDARNRLMRAGEAFNLALFNSASWTPAMQEQSYPVLSRLLARGSVDRTVGRMTDDAIARTATLLGAFCGSAEVCDRVDRGESQPIDASAAIEHVPDSQTQ